MSTALTDHTVFPRAQLLLIVASVAGPRFGEHAARGKIQPQDRMGLSGACAVPDLL
jgi:hypothetical protein